MSTPGHSRPPHHPDGEHGDTSERISMVVSDPLPGDVLAENIEDRRVTGPDDGFGQLWRKQYWIRLDGADVTPTELVKVWKERYTEFWPEGSRLYQPPDGLEKGDVVAADLSMIGGTRVGTGIVVIEENDTSFTFSTLEGHTLSGNITFSGRSNEGVTVAHVEVFMRSSDPIFEIGMPLGGHQHENKFWEASLKALAHHFGVDAEPEMKMERLDRRFKWRNARNIVHNSFLHTYFHLATRPFRRLAGAARSGGSPS